MASGEWNMKSVLLVAACTLSNLYTISSSGFTSLSLPIIGKDFDVGEDQLQWLISSFSLSSGCLLIFFGRLADLHGRKKAFLLGSAWSAVFSLACGFGQSAVVLYVLRGLQGLGSAAMIPSALGILAHHFPPSRARSIAFATFSAGAPVGAGLSYVVGGVLIQYTAHTWRAPFFFSAGLALACLVGGALSIDRDTPSNESNKRVDWIGALLVTVGLVLITFALGDGELAPDRWSTPYIIALLVIGVILVGVFIWWQWFLEARMETARYPSPLMKLSLWARAKYRFSTVQAIAFLELAGFQSWCFWSQLYYQDFIGLRPFETALRFLPMAVVGVMLNVIVALVVGRIDVIYLIVLGTGTTSLAPLLFALIKPSAPYWAFGFPAAIFSVFGADFVFASGTLYIAKISHPHEQSLSGGLFQTLVQLGTALGLAITTIVHNMVLRNNSPGGVLEDASRDVQLKAYHDAQWTAFAFPVCASLLAVLFMRAAGIVGHNAPTREEQAGGDTESQSVKEKTPSPRLSYETGKELGTSRPQSEVAEAL